MTTMPSVAIHHVSVLSTDLDQSVQFYQGLFDLKPLPRPPFATAGAWLACGHLQVHINVYPPGTYRSRGIDRDDGHFAFRTDDFEGFVERLKSHGFREDADESDPQRMIVLRKGMAGFPQVYVADPDRNIIEINGAPP
jgi:catechol 2,3-dioxygenase-like lactoylglutathione lyase family enzyme